MVGLIFALRPGKRPDTPSSHEAGETWRYLSAHVDSGGESALSRMTIAHVHPGRGSWGYDITAAGRKHAHRCDIGFETREAAMDEVEYLLADAGYGIADRGIADCRC